MVIKQCDTLMINSDLTHPQGALIDMNGALKQCTRGTLGQGK
jgi:hypothetical protein